jgi:hypothetical protein
MGAAKLRVVVAIRLAMRNTAMFLALALAALAGCASLSSHPPHATDLSGDWKLDESLSDDPRAMMRQQGQHGSGHGMHHGGGMGGGMPQLVTPGAATTGSPGGGMHGGHHGGGGNGGNWGGGRHGPGGEFLTRPASLSIHQAATQLELVADGVSTDFAYGEKVMASVQGGAAERSSGWKGQDFVVKYDVTDGPKATRSYELNDGGKQLVVTTQVAGGRGPDVKFRTVYERAAAG